MENSTIMLIFVYLLMKKTIVILVNLLCFYTVHAQTQTIRGMVLDRETRQVLEGAKIMITTIGKDSGRFALSNASGEYMIPGLSVGRQNILITLEKYNDIVLQNIILTSAKET